jgi:molecular chaperone GrpE
MSHPECSSSGNGAGSAERPATEPDTATADGNAAPTEATDTAALGSATVADVERDLQVALAKASENHELYLRAVAEGENIRRRAQDDISKAHKFAVESFAESMVPVIDSLEKALEAQGASAEQLREGVEITLRQVRAAFEKNRLTEINPAGQKFDPHRHQAIATVPAGDGVPANQVVAVLQKGWMIADRVLRPALVTVAQG